MFRVCMCLIFLFTGFHQGSSNTKPLHCAHTCLAFFTHMGAKPPREIFDCEKKPFLFKKNFERKQLFVQHTAHTPPLPPPKKISTQRHTWERHTSLHQAIGPAHIWCDECSSLISAISFTRATHQNTHLVYQRVDAQSRIEKWFVAGPLVCIPYPPTHQKGHQDR